MWVCVWGGGGAGTRKQRWTARRGPGLAKQHPPRAQPRAPPHPPLPCQPPNPSPAETPTHPYPLYGPGHAHRYRVISPSPHDPHNRVCSRARETCTRVVEWVGGGLDAPPRSPGLSGDRQHCKMLLNDPASCSHKYRHTWTQNQLAEAGAEGGQARQPGALPACGSQRHRGRGQRCCSRMLEGRGRTYEQAPTAGPDSVGVQGDGQAAGTTKARGVGRVNVWHGERAPEGKVP